MGEIEGADDRPQLKEHQLRVCCVPANFFLIPYPLIVFSPHEEK